MPEDKISLSDFIIGKLDFHTLGIESKERQTAVQYFIQKNIITIFKTNEFASCEIDTVVLEETIDLFKIRYRAIAIQNKGWNYKIEVNKEKEIIFTSRETIPLFIITIENDKVKNKLVTWKEQDLVIEEQEINWEEGYYKYKTSQRLKKSKGQSLYLYPINFSLDGYEWFKLVKDFQEKKESTYLLERLYERLKENNLRKIPTKTSELENLMEIFDCLERECENEEYKRERKKTT